MGLNPVFLHDSTKLTVLQRLWTLTCPTTQRRYTIDDVEIHPFRTDRIVWSRCRWCDALGRTAGHPAYDPTMPQVHRGLVRS
jgi:hypothetical protein